MDAAVHQQLPTMVLKPPSSFRYDKTKDGWTLVEDIPLTGEPTLSLSGFLEEGESSVLGELMLERGKANAEELGPLAGQHHAEALLDQQDQIPVEWRGYYLVCPGTVWQDSDGIRKVAYLSWNGERWKLYFSWLGHGRWVADDRLVRLPQV